MTVALSVESPLLADFLRYLFPLEDGYCKVSARRPIGKMMIVFAKVSQDPLPDKPTGNNVVQLRLPSHHNVTKRLENHWLYYDAYSTDSLNLALKATFDLDFEGYYRKGVALGMMKKDIVEAYIFSRKLVPDSFDSLHKRAYRREQDSMKKVYKVLLRKSFYFDEALDYSGLILDKQYSDENRN